VREKPVGLEKVQLRGEKIEEQRHVDVLDARPERIKRVKPAVLGDIGGWIEEVQGRRDLRVNKNV
jgi:hypothetical protein